MANVTYDLQWKEAMVELLDQLEVLDPSPETSYVVRASETPTPRSEELK